MWKILFFSGLILSFNNYAFARFLNFNDLSEGKVVSGAGVFEDFVLEGHSGDLFVGSGVFGSNTKDLNIFNKGCDSWSGCSEVRFKIEFLVPDVDFVSFDIRGNGGDDIGMTSFASDENHHIIYSDGALVAPPGWYDGDPFYDNIRYVDNWDSETGDWIVNFTIRAEGIKFIDLVYYPLDYDISFDNFTYRSEPVPEPSTILLFGAGLVGLVVVRKNKKRVHSLAPHTRIIEKQSH